MKLTVLKIMCLAIILSLNQQVNCDENENITMIYAVDKGLYKVEPGSSRKKLTEFKGYVTGLALHNDYMFVSVRRSSEEFQDSTIWRIKKSNTSTSFEIEDSSKEQFHIVNAAEADILSMVVADDYIYSGRSDGVVWRCSANKAHSCENFKEYAELDKYPIISEIEYSPVENQIYMVQSSEQKQLIFDEWCHQMYSLLIGDSEVVPKSFYVGRYQIQGWATLKFAFGSLWIGDLGKVVKCSVRQPLGASKSEITHCLIIHDFKKPVYLNIEASKRYLYVRLEKSEFIWRCDPKKTESICLDKIDDVSDADRMGPFLIL